MCSNCSEFETNNIIILGDGMSTRNVLSKDGNTVLQQHNSAFPKSNQLPHNLVKTAANQSLGSPIRLEETCKDTPQQYNTPSFQKATSNARQVPPALKHPSSSTGDLLPGIDLDTVAAMMQGGKGN